MHKCKLVFRLLQKFNICHLVPNRIIYVIILVFSLFLSLFVSLFFFLFTFAILFQSMLWKFVYNCICAHTCCPITEHNGEYSPASKPPDQQSGSYSNTITISTRSRLFYFYSIYFLFSLVNWKTLFTFSRIFHMNNR